MLRWMLRVDNWLDVASLENVEEGHSFLFLKKNLMKIFFFLKNFEILNFFKELKILNFFWKKPKKYESNAPSPKAFFENFVFFFFFLNMKICSLSKKWRRWRWSKSDEDLFMMIFFLFGWKTYPLNENSFGWKLMRIVG